MKNLFEAAKGVIKHAGPVVLKKAKEYGVPLAVTLISTHASLKEKAELNELKKTVADLKTKVNGNN